jgi:hypothetical protein
MKIIHLPSHQSEVIHLECFREDGSSYCIETKRCHAISVESDVIDVTLTNLPGRKQVRFSHGWQDDGRQLSFNQRVEFEMA